MTSDLNISFFPSDERSENFLSIQAIPDEEFLVEGFTQEEALRAKRVLLIRAFSGEDVSAYTPVGHVKHNLWFGDTGTRITVKEWTEQLRDELAIINKRGRGV